MVLSMLLYVCSEYWIEHDNKYSTLIFCCKKNLDIHIPNFVLHGETFPGISKCTYLGHSITEDLSDSGDMSRQYKIIYAQCNFLI